MDNASHGFRVTGDDNRLLNNYAKSNAAEGFRLDGNRLMGNVALTNGEEGFRIRDGQDNIMINNRAQENGITDHEAGIRIQDDGNIIRRNAFLRSYGDGILVREGGENNTITHNLSLLNFGTDLVDENLDCDNNRWSRNRFETASPDDCID